MCKIAGLRDDPFMKHGIENKTSYELHSTQLGDNDLEAIANNRLLFCSEDKDNPVTLKKIIPNNELRNYLFELSGNSPRDFFALLSEIQLNDCGDCVEYFSHEAVNEGTLKFCKQYDFQAARTSKENIKSWINRLLAIKRGTFTIDEYSSILGISKTQTAKHIIIMIDLDFIKPSIFLSCKGDKMYEVIDPRIVHLMSRGVMSLD